MNSHLSYFLLSLFGRRAEGGGAEKGSNTMSESDAPLHDEEVFGDELTDAVLEVAVSKCWEGPASSVTIGFCSGPETCPGLR